MKGTIVTRTLPDGTKRFHAVWRAKGKQRWKTFPRRKQAERFLTTTVKLVHDGAWQETRPLPMGELLDRWLSDSLDVRLKQGLTKSSTAKSYRSMVESHLRPAFGEIRSDRLSAREVGDWVRGMAEKINANGQPEVPAEHAPGEKKKRRKKTAIAPKSYNNILNLLHAILAWARHPAQGYLAHDPLIGQKRLPRPRVEREFLEPQEIEAILTAARATPPDDTMITVGVFSGLRRGELFAVQWADVDWGNGQDGGRVFVRRSIYQGKITTPKTEHSARTVDVPQRVLDELLIYREMFPPKGGGFVFRTEAGTPVDPDDWYKRRFLKVVERAGLRRVGLHALRHTYASLLINQGESIKYVSRQLGHASINITADLYGHLFRETGVAAMRRLGARMNGGPSNGHLTEGAGTARTAGNSKEDAREETLSTMER